MSANPTEENGSRGHSSKKGIGPDDPNRLADSELQSESGSHIEPQANRGSTGWDQFRVFALERIRAKARELGSVAKQVTDKNRAAPQSILGTAQPENEAGEATKTQASASSDAIVSAADPKKSKQVALLAKSFDRERQDEQKGALRRQLALSGMGGILASAIAHVLLIIVLAIVTLKMPSAPAGMAFEAATSTPVEDQVEISQPVEASAPDSSESTPTQPSSFDFSEQLTEVSSPISEALGQTAPATGGISSAAQMSGSSSAMPSSNASFFGAAAGGNCFCYVIDASGSMRGGPWIAARSELLKSLASLKPKQRFYIIMFKRDFEAIPLPGERDPAPRALYASKENLEHARRWLMGLKIGGSGGPPKEAIKFAIEKEPDAIYLLTDGVTRVKDVASFIQTQNTITDIIFGSQLRVPIHTIAFYSLEGQALLRQIASENKGQFIYVPDPTKRK